VTIKDEIIDTEPSDYEQLQKQVMDVFVKGGTEFLFEQADVVLVRLRKATAHLNVVCESVDPTENPGEFLITIRCPLFTKPLELLIYCQS